jgi:hypothetical protein
MQVIIDKLNKTQDKVHAFQRAYEEEMRKEAVDRRQVQVIRAKKEKNA